MNESLEELIEQLIDSYINSWYKSEISNDMAFVNEIRLVYLKFLVEVFVKYCCIILKYSLRKWFFSLHSIT